MRKDKRSIIEDIKNSTSRGLKWLKEQQPDTVKEMSRSIQVLSIWDESASTLIEKLLSLKKDGFWQTQTPINDTVRAFNALRECGIDQPDVILWILEQQCGDRWNNSEIDTAYALIALGETMVRNEPGCTWLVQNYGERWEHAGTTSLIITALIKQDREKFCAFIKDRASWLMSKRDNRGWNYTSTSNLVIQALMLSGADDSDIRPSIEWLIEKQLENGSWGDITSTSLSLVSLRMYLDKLNSISVE